MPFDIDQRMLVYLGMITAGIFIIPMVEPTIPYLYQVIGVALIGIGGLLVIHKSRKNI